MDSKEAFVTEDMQNGDILFELIITFLLVFLLYYCEKSFKIFAIMESNDDSDVIPICHFFDHLFEHL